MTLIIKHPDGGLTTIPKAMVDLLSDNRLICELGSFYGSYQDNVFIIESEEETPDMFEEIK